MKLTPITAPSRSIRLSFWSLLVSIASFFAALSLVNSTAYGLPPREGGEDPGGGGNNFGTIIGPPTLTLWEGNGCTQNQVAWTLIEPHSLPRTIPHSGMHFENDEARSMKLFRVPAGRVFKVYDDSNGSTADDYTIIFVKRLLAERCLYSFEYSFEDEDLRVIYYPPSDGQNLDGKVSSLRIE